MNIGWEDLQVFFAVLEERSFSAAARRLGLTQPTVSRRVASLEEQVGRPLFRRDVEGAHPTEEGSKLAPAALQMARFAGELGEVAKGFDDRPAGVVRIAVPPGTALEVIVPLAAQMRERLPDIFVHAICAVDYLDLSRGHAELALRAKAPTQPDLMVVAHARVQLGVVASASYAERLARKLAGKKPTLKDLDWIAWAYPNEHVEPNPSLAKYIPDFEPAFASNDYNVQVRATALGLGAMILPKARPKDAPYPPWVDLQIPLPFPPADAYLVCARAMRFVPRVRAVIAEMRRALSEIEGVELLDHEEG